MRHRPNLLLLGLALLLVAGCSTTDADGQEKMIELHMQNAQMFYDGGHYRSAIDQANKVLALDPDEHKARFVRAMSLLNLTDPQNVQEAEQELSQLVHEDFGEKQFRVWIGLGMAHAAVGDLYDMRARNAQAQIDREPLTARDLAPRRKEALAKRDEHWRASNEAMEKVFTFQDQPLARNDPVALYYLYRNLTLLGHPDQALPYEERHLAVVVGSKKQWLKGIDEYPSAADIYRRKLHGAEKQEVAVREMMANTLYELGRLEDALKQLDEVIGLAPERADAYLNRAQIHREMGQHAYAVVDLKKFIQKTEMTPDDPRAQEAVQLLRDSQEKMIPEEDR